MAEERGHSTVLQLRVPPDLKFKNFALVVFVCFVGTQFQQLLFPYKASTDRIFWREKVCLLRGTYWVF